MLPSDRNLYKKCRFQERITHCPSVDTEKKVEHNEADGIMCGCAYGTYNIKENMRRAKMREVETTAKASLASSLLSEFGHAQHEQGPQKVVSLFHSG